MEANINRLFILLLALVCVAQATSAFDIKTETVNPASGALEPGQQVTAWYVLTYDMVTTGGNDETFEFSTGLSNPTWDFTVLPRWGRHLHHQEDRVLPGSDGVRDRLW